MKDKKLSDVKGSEISFTVEVASTIVSNTENRWGVSIINGDTAGGPEVVMRAASEVFLYKNKSFIQANMAATPDPAPAPDPDPAPAPDPAPSAPAPSMQVDFGPIRNGQLTFTPQGVKMFRANKRWYKIIVTVSFTDNATAKCYWQALKGVGPNVARVELALLCAEDDTVHKFEEQTEGRHQESLWLMIKKGYGGEKAEDVLISSSGGPVAATTGAPSSPPVGKRKALSTQTPPNRKTCKRDVDQIFTSYGTASPEISDDEFYNYFNIE